MPRGQNTKETIAQVAIELFAERGVDATSIRDIASAAGITEPAIYRHYASKAALILELYMTYCIELSGILEREVGGIPDLKARIAAMVHQFCILFDERPALFRFLLMVQHRSGPVESDTQPNPVETVRKVIVEGIRTGALPDQDADLATASVFGIVLQTALFKVFGRLTGKMSDYRPAITSSVWAALTADKT